MAEELSCLKVLRVDKVSFDSMSGEPRLGNFGELWGTGQGQVFSTRGPKPKMSTKVSIS
jgi:hypothetical protein